MFSRTRPAPLTTGLASSSGRLDRYCQLDGQATLDGAADRAELVCAAVVAEDVIRGEADTSEIGHALAVAVGCIDRLADVLRQGDLGGRDLVRGLGRLGEARVDLEMDVRPATRIAGRKDAVEGDLAGAVGLLHAAQVVLV